MLFNQILMVSLEKIFQKAKLVDRKDETTARYELNV